jgi:hypothetical protein
MRPSPKWFLAVSGYRKGDWNFQLPGHLNTKVGLLKGLSCVMGNYHAQFLGGLGPAMASGYPVFVDILIPGKASVRN